MSPFAWFAIILTAVYIIYNTVMIMNDLYGKKPEEHSSTEEIDVPASGDVAEIEETPVVVSENDGGFSVGERNYEANLFPEDTPSEEEAVQTTDGKAETEKPQPGKSLNTVMYERGEGIDTQFDDEYCSEDFKEALVSEIHPRSGRPAVVKKPMFDEI